MAKKKSQTPAKKTAKKPAPAQKAAKKPSSAKPAPKAANKPAPKTAKPSKPTPKPAAKQKPSPKAVKKTVAASKSKPLAQEKNGAVAKKSIPVKSKSVEVPVKPVKKEEVKTKPAPVKQAPAKDIKPAAPLAAAAPKAKKAVVPPAPLPPPPSNLPKLPKGFVLKKQKGKLAPGEKRVFKTSVITHHVISDIALEDEKKSKPEPKGKFVLEFILHSPVSLLYDFLTTPNGLAEWFADGVDLKNEVYSFDWDGQKQTAKIVSAKLDNHIRLRWLDKPEGSYFEFRIQADELTNEISLTVTDFGDGPDDIATSRRLWEAQIHRLMKALGTY